MRTLGIALALLVSAAAYAQDTKAVTTLPPQPGPVLRAVTPDDAATRVDVEVGAVRMTTGSGRYTFVYLPVLPPLQGTAFRSSMETPNALALTGTTIPQKPGTRLRSVVAVR